MMLGRSSDSPGNVGRLWAGPTIVADSERQLLDRFVANRDEAAFGAIVARHGPMVVRVCRAILDHPTDVDDAFQATFLVLVRRAGSLRDRDGLSPWLHGVARRVALRARNGAARRRGREVAHPDLVAVAADRAAPTAEARERAALLHAEIDRLAAPERSALILCDLEGLTHQEAADQLGWPLGTVKTRINRGRDRLRARLERRGVNLNASAVALAPIAKPAAVVSSTLVAATTRTALAVVAGRTLAGAVASAPVLCLTQGALRSMIIAKLKVVGLVLAATTAVVALPGVIAFQGAGPQPDSAGAPRPKDTKPANLPPAVSLPAAAPEGSFTPPPAPDLDGASQAVLRRLQEPSPLPTIAAALLATGRTEISLVDLMAQLRKATIDREQGLPDGVVSTFSETATTLASEHSLDLATILAQAGMNFSLWDALKRESGQIGLAYRLRDGQLCFDAANKLNSRGPGGMRPGLTRARDDEERNEAIRVKLDQVVPMKFPRPVTLDHFVGQVRALTSAPDGKPIPIYVDGPTKLAVQPKRTQTDENDVKADDRDSITIDLDGVPLRTSLRLALSQIDLDYIITGGVLIIADQETLQKLSGIANPPAVPGGVGGMGGQGGFM